MDTKGVRLDKDDQRRLNAIVEETEADESVVMRKLLRRGLDHHETNQGDKAVTDGGNPDTKDPIPRLSQNAVQFFAGIAGALVFIQYTSGLNLTKYAAFSFTVAFLFALIYHGYDYLPDDALNLRRGDTA